MISASELEALLEENETLRLEVRRIRGQRPNDLCWHCEKKRRWIATLSGSWLCLCWTQIKENWPDLNENLAQWIAVLLMIGPLITVYAHWKFRIFKRNEEWKRWPVYVAFVAYREARKTSRFRH